MRTRARVHVRVHARVLARVHARVHVRVQARVQAHVKLACKRVRAGFANMLPMSWCLVRLPRALLPMHADGQCHREYTVPLECLLAPRILAAVLPRPAYLPAHLLPTYAAGPGTKDPARRWQPEPRIVAGVFGGRRQHAKAVPAQLRHTRAARLHIPLADLGCYLGGDTAEL